MHGSDRCGAHLGRNGAPTLLSDELTEQLATILRAGNYLYVGLRAVGIAPRTFQVWMLRGKSERAEDARYRDFREKVERARAEGEVRNVTVIARAATDSWTAAAWLLERQYPERWGRPSVRSRDADEDAAADSPPSSPRAEDPFAEVDELAARRRDRSPL